MNKQVESVEQYLNEVGMHLGDLADKDQIIIELRAHIWDLANQLSINKGLSVQEAFDDAILRMEDPQILASKFLDEEPTSTKVDWKAPITTPESKIKNEQFEYKYKSIAFRERRLLSRICRCKRPFL